MLRLDRQGGVVPIYIGRAGRYGKSGTLVSANLEGIRPTSDGTGWTNGRKFARWGRLRLPHRRPQLRRGAGHDPRQPAPKFRR